MPINFTEIKKIMLQKNISQNELAEIMEVSKSRVSNLLNGKSKKPQIKTINSLANALGVKVERILEGE